MPAQSRALWLERWLRNHSFDERIALSLAAVRRVRDRTRHGRCLSGSAAMRNRPFPLAVVAFGCLGLAVAAQEHQPQSKPDHMEHRFDDPERYAKSFDDPARDSWQMPTRVIEALKLSPNAS